MPLRTPQTQKHTWPLALTLALGFLPLALVARSPRQVDPSGPSSEPTAGQAGQTSTCASLPPGLCSLSSLRLGSGAIVDARESPFEAYLEGLSTATGQAHVVALGALELEPKNKSLPTVVVGEARSAWKNNTTIGKGAFVTGSIEPIPLRSDWPALPDRDLRRAKSMECTEGESSLTGPLLELQRLEVLGDARLTLVGPLDLWVQELHQRDASTITIDTSKGNVVVHILQGWSQAQGATWHAPKAGTTRLAVLVGTGRPAIDESALAPKSEEDLRAQALRARLRGQTQPAPRANVPLELKGSGVFHGLVYAPFSAIGLPKAFAFHGVLTAQSVVLEPEARFTTDDDALLAWPEGLLQSANDRARTP